MKPIYVVLAVVILLTTAAIWGLRPSNQTSAWSQYTEAVYKAFPSQKGTLAKGATDTQIDKLLAAILHQLPPELIAALKLNNGGAGRHGSNSIFFGTQMLSVDGIIRDYENWVLISREDPQDYADDYTSVPHDTIKPMYTNSAWVPFAADGAGNNIGIDFDPGPNGRSGQIISFGADEIEKLKIADSYPEFLTLMQSLLTHPKTRASESRGFSLSDIYIVDALKEVRPHK
ncbi:MAG: SMI1/KNR4 family protein [Litoreibacter sp.]|uniref:SMI1/KNR4 family protein n=1 Tax=Litoreibacter sp. TaxID=1969459 RepID=UPI003299C776